MIVAMLPQSNRKGALEYEDEPIVVKGIMIAYCSKCDAPLLTPQQSMPEIAKAEKEYDEIINPENQN